MRSERQTFPLTMAYVAASNGIYRGTLQKELDLSTVVGTIYYAEITADGPVGERGFWRFQVEVRDRVDGVQ